MQGLGPVPSQVAWQYAGGKATGYNPADTTPFYLTTPFGISTDPSTTAPTASSSTVARVIAPILITDVYVDILVAGTLGTTEQATISIRVNNTTDFTITAVAQYNAVSQGYSNNALAIQLNPGDFFVVKVVPPAWATNPTAVYHNCQIVGRFN